MKGIGFIGTGVMGRSMAGHLLKAGHPVTVYTRTKTKAAPLLEAGALWADRPAQLAAMADVIIKMVGDPAAFDSVRPIFERMGKNIMLQGGAVCGQHTKMVNQIAIAAGMVGLCEAMAYARRAGLHAENVLECISGGAAGSWSLSNYGPRMLKEDFQPGFYVKHFIKDMRIALESARAMKLETPGLALAEKLYAELAAKGGGDYGTQALYKIIEGRS